MRFFITQINPRSLGSWCIKGTEESTLEVHSSVPFTHHDHNDLGLICLVKQNKIRFQIPTDLRIQYWVSFMKRTLRYSHHSNHVPLERILSITTCTLAVMSMTYQVTSINNDLFVQPPLPLIQQFKSLLSLHHLQSSTQPHTLYKAVLSVLHNKIQNTNPSASWHL